MQEVGCGGADTIDLLTKVLLQILDQLGLLEFFTTIKNILKYGLIVIAILFVVYIGYRLYGLVKPSSKERIKRRF